MNPFALDPTEQDNQLTTASLNPGDPSQLVHWYSGIGESVGKGGAAIFNDIAMAGADATDPLVDKRVSMYGNQNTAPKTFKQQTHDYARELMPDPATAGIVGQALQGAIEIGGEYVLATTATMNPYAGAAIVAGIQGNKSAQLAMDEGVDTSTAIKKGLIEGGVAGVGALLPMHIAPAMTAGFSPAARVVMNAAAGAAVQNATGIASRGSISALLEANGYHDMAAQYKPFDNTSLAVDTVMGSIFGMVGHGLAVRGEAKASVSERAAKNVLPSDGDLALAANNTHHIELDTAPGVPADPAAREAHVSAFNTALEQLLNDEPVTVGENITKQNFVDNPAHDTTARMTGDAVAAHLSDVDPEILGLQKDLASRGIDPNLDLYSAINRVSPEETAAAVKAEPVKYTIDPEANRAILALKRGAESGTLNKPAADLGIWVLQQNPKLGSDLTLRIGDPSNPDAGGSYKPIAKIATLAAEHPDFNPDPHVAAHEIMHHAERMLPDDLRAMIKADFKAKLTDLLKDPEKAPLVSTLTNAADGDREALFSIMRGISDGQLPPDVYQFTSSSEYWATNAARILADRANPALTARLKQYFKELIEKIKDAFGYKSDTPIIKALDAAMKADGKMTGDMLYAGGLFNSARTSGAGAEAPGVGVKQENFNGFEPDLRVKISTKGMTLPEKPLILTGTNNKNAGRQIAAIDEILAKFPDADQSPEEWSRMMAYAMATDDVPVPPYRFLKEVNSDGAVTKLEQLKAGQISDADHGFENSRLFREAYIGKELDVETTGKLFMWSFLSRGVSPYTQEGLFIDAFPGVGEWIKKAADGNLTEADFPAYEEWAKSVAPKGSGQPGSGATHNLNAFGNLFLFKMGQRDENGMSRLQTMHNMMEDPNMTGKELRRWFMKNGEGVGIDNKVVSFTLLVAGFHDVMVLDRVQIRQLWDDGRFNGRNLYDGRKEDGKPVTGSALSEISYGARGLLIYEAIERALAKRVDNIYASLGRPQDASIGRYHWETWVADSQQEASHGTLDAILHDAKGDTAMIAEVTAKEGEYGSYRYGTRYGRDANGPYFLYKVGDGQEYRFSPEAFRQFIDEVKSPKNGVVPTKFKVTEAGNAPWYERPEVNRDRLQQLAAEYSDQSSPNKGSGTVQANGSGKAVSDSTGSGRDPYSAENVIANRPDLALPQDDGSTVPASKALAQADAEITTATKESQAYDVAAACALRG